MIYVVAALFILSVVFVWLCRKHASTEALLLISAVTLPLEWNVQVGSSARVGVYDLIFVLSLGVWAHSLLRSRGRIRVNRHILGTALLGGAALLWATLSWLLHDDNPSLVYGGWKSLKLLILGVYFILGIQLAYQSLKIQKACLIALLVACMCNGAIGVIQRLSGGQWLTGIYTNQLFLGFLTPLPERLLEGTRWLTLEVQAANGYRAHGTFLDQTWYAPFMLAAFCLWLGFTVKRSNLELSNPTKLACLLICAGGLFASSVRGAFVGMIIVTAMAFYFAPRRLIKISIDVLKAGLCLLVVFLVVSLTSDRLSNLFTEVDRIAGRLATVADPESQIEFQGRLRLWELAINRVLTQSPVFGKGQLITPSEAGWVGDSASDTEVQLPLHSQYLALIYYSGFPALLLFFLSCALFLISARKLSKQAGILGQIGTGTILMIIGLLINGLVADWFSFASTATAALFWFVGAYNISLHKLNLSTAAVRRQQNLIAS